ncbi:hypothetical protein HK405_009244 [Cladochytrium tenue]|nr:hypothetical protein HK405_009244 [Cladochytrium tenue]
MASFLPASDSAADTTAIPAVPSAATEKLIVESNASAGAGTAAAAAARGAGANFVRALPARGLTVAFFAILFVWLYGAEGGVGTDQSSLFGLHALLMSLFTFIVLQESVLCFFAPSFGLSRRARVAFHAVAGVAAAGCLAGGLAAVARYKDLTTEEVNDGEWLFPYFHLFSPHAWAGVALGSVFAVQLVFGLLRLAGPATALTAATAAGRSHALVGAAVYIGAAAVCAMGFQDMQSSDLAWLDINANMSAAMGMDDGYMQDSSYSVYAAVSPILIFLIVLSVFFTKAL